MKSINLLILLAIIFSTTNIYSQDLSTRIVKGVITDKTSGKPIALDIQIEDSKGKKFKIKSNSTGNYEQLLQANETYKFTFLDPEVLREEVDFKATAPDASYAPQIKNFEVFVMKEGVELYDFDVFDKGSESISSAGKAKLENLKSIMRFNRALSINIEIHPDDSNNNALSQKRLAKLKELTDGWGKFNRKAAYKTSEKAGKDAKADTRIIISKVESTLK